MLLLRVLQLILWDSLCKNLLPFIILGPLGVLLIPIAMLFRYEGEPDPSYHKNQYEGWKYIKLPRWAKVWEGESGLMGDGTRIHTAKNPGSFWAMYQWAVFRNPVGGWDRLIGFSLRAEDRIEYWGHKRVGDTTADAGWHFVVTHGTRVVTGFYTVLPIGRLYYADLGLRWYILPTKFELKRSRPKCIRFRLGFKVKPTYIGLSRPIDATPGSLTLKNFGTGK